MNFGKVKKYIVFFVLFCILVMVFISGFVALLLLLLAFYVVKFIAFRRSDKGKKGADNKVIDAEYYVVNEKKDGK